MSESFSRGRFVLFCDALGFEVEEAMIKSVKDSSPVLSARRGAQQGSTYMEWIS